jgi:hypothetical protein
MTLINVELPNGKTVKVNSDWWYTMTDAEIDKFFKLQMVNFDYHNEIVDPFDNSAMDAYQQYEKDAKDFEDEGIDFEPEDWD